MNCGARKRLRMASWIMAFCLIIQTMHVLPVSAAEQRSKTYDCTGATVTYTVTGIWDSGYNASIKITNIGDKAISDWSLVSSCTDVIATAWNATVNSANNQITFDNAGYNQDIAVGSSVEFGFSSGTAFSDFPETVNVIGKSLCEVTEGYTVEYKVTSDWGSGFNGAIVINNTSTENLKEWQLEFSLDNEISNIWNAEIISHDAEKYVVRGCIYNSVISPNASVEVGFSVVNGSAANKGEAFILSALGTASIPEITDPSDSEGTFDYDNFGVELSANENEYLANGKSVTIYFYAETYDNVNSVDLYEETLGFIGKMYDNGQYNNSGDDMMGDGIFTYKYTFTPDITADKVLSFTAKLQNGKSSDIYEVYTFVPFSQEEIDDMMGVLEATNALAKYPLVSENGEMNRYEAGVNVLSELKADGKILYFLFDENIQAFCCAFANGIEFQINIEESTGLTNGSGENTKIYNKELVADDDFYTYIEPSSFVKKGEADYSNIKLFAINSFPDDELSGRTDLPQKCASKTINEFEDDYKLDVTRDETPTVESLRYALSDYDVIWYFGHGGLIAALTQNEISSCQNTGIFSIPQSTQYKTAWCIYTNEVSDYNFNLEKYQLDLKMKRISISEWIDPYGNTHVAYVLFGDFFNKYYSGKLQNCIVVSAACFFYGTTNEKDSSFADTFISSCGAACVTGFENSVLTEYASDTTKYFINALLCGKSCKKAYELVGGENYNDGNDADGDPGTWRISYNYNLPDPMILINGNFEDGLNGWKRLGDARVLVKLGEISDGSYMAFISTGIGSLSSQNLAGTQGSSIGQTLACTGGILSFSYDVVSEEPMEYVGSSYDDKFLVRIRNHNSGKIIFEETLATINSSSWYGVSGIDFDGGDSSAFHTGWKKNVIDLSNFKGQCIDLEFIVCDVGDSAYDTAVLLDNIFIK